MIEAQIESLRTEFQADADEAQKEVDAVHRKGELLDADAAARAKARSGAPGNKKGKA